MKRKILVLIAALLILSMIQIPLALTEPWYYPKNNEKFQQFSTNFEPAEEDYAKNIEWSYKPSEEEPNVIIVNWDTENFETYELTVNEWTYVLGTDFEYESHVKRTAIGAPFWWVDPLTGAPFGGMLTQARVEYKYDFSAYEDGIDGTLEMLMLWHVKGLFEDFDSSIVSLRGTGDLRNVQILATVGEAGHEGIVIGWPDIPPAA